MLDNPAFGHNFEGVQFTAPGIFHCARDYLNQNLLYRLPLAVLFILSAARLIVIFDLEIE